MNIINDGGAAFPRPVAEAEEFVNEAQRGMSLLDWYAGLAMKLTVRLTRRKLPATSTDEEFAKFDPQCLAVDCARAYEVAAAMIAERTKRYSAGEQS